MQYRYTGTDEKHFPTLGKLVKPGDVIETEEAVQHPELEPIEAKPRKQSKTQEDIEQATPTIE